MSTAKESLYSTIEQLTDEEARRALKLIHGIRKRSHVSPTLRRLANDPAFRMPAKGRKGFRRVEPAVVKGIPASRLLAEDRR